MARNRKKDVENRGLSGCEGKASSGGSSAAHISSLERVRRAAVSGPRKRPRQARGQDTVGVILQAAAEVFAALGYKGTTTNKIAERAGVSVGSLYQYFPNKEVLMLSLIEQHMRQGVPRIESAVAALATPGASLRDGVRRLVAETVALHELSPRLHQVLFDEMPRTEAMRALKQEAERRSAEQTAEVLRALPGIDVPDPTLSAHVLVQSLESLSHWLAVTPPPGIDKERCIDEITDLLVRYISVGNA